jgi:glycosyltransferase involved in cell wall biosynthesis
MAVPRLGRRAAPAAAVNPPASVRGTLIGMVSTSYPRGADDWAGGFVRERVRTLVAAGARIEVVAAGSPGDRAAVSPETGVEVLRVSAPALGDHPLFYGAGAPEMLEAAGPMALVAALGFVARMAAAVATQASRWHSVESHWLAPCALLASAIAPGRPHRAFAHGGDVALLERIPGGRALARHLAAKGVALTFASSDLHLRFARLCGVRPEALGAMVEPARFDSTLFRPLRPVDRAALRRGLNCTGPVVLAVGRLVPVKGFDLLVRAVGRLPRSRRPTLVVIGEGPERARLIAMAADRGVSLRLPGGLAPTEVAAWMGAADLYVQPSRTLRSGRSEGSPLAVREALAVGVPAVACAVGGLIELARSSDVHLVAPEQPAALAAAISALLRYSA